MARWNDRDGLGSGLPRQLGLCLLKFPRERLRGDRVTGDVRVRVGTQFVVDTARTDGLDHVGRVEQGIGFHRTPGIGVEPPVLVRSVVVALAGRLAEVTDHVERDGDVESLTAVEQFGEILALSLPPVAQMVEVADVVDTPPEFDFQTYRDDAAHAGRMAQDPLWKADATTAVVTSYHGKQAVRRLDSDEGDECGCPSDAPTHSDPRPSVTTFAGTIPTGTWITTGGFRRGNTHVTGRTTPTMNCIAHRGFAGDYPENTVGALSAAAVVADWVEFDVRRCASGEVVVVHDETVDRVTDATGAVADLSRAELAGLDVLDTGEGVPTLAEVLDAVPSSTGVNVELKEHGLATDVVDALAAHGGDVLISSFDAGVLAESSVVADYPLALLFDDEPVQRLERALELDCAAIHPHWDVCDEAFVARAHEAGSVVNAWTIRDSVSAISARSAGVDGLIADHERLCDG